MQTVSDHIAGGGGVFGAAIQGQRSEQQDSFRSIWLAAEQGWLLIIADGMGGHSAGGMASRIAVDSFIDSFTSSRAGKLDLQPALQAALDHANLQIAKAQAAAPELNGMGTTLVAVYISPNNLGWISVGDSPLWLLQNGKLLRLNEDHSLRAVARDNAKVSGSILRSVLNGEPIPLIDCQVPGPPPGVGNVLLLASDGLLTLQEKEIVTEAARHTASGPEAVARSLLKAIEDRGKPKQDNCTVVVAFLPASTAPAVTSVASAKSAEKKHSGLLLAVIVFAVIAFGIFTWRFYL